MSDIARFNAILGAVRFQHGAEQRRSTVDRINEFLVKPTRVVGFDALTVGVAVATVPPSLSKSQDAESLYDVNFPVWFVEKPSMSFGAELDDTQSPTAQAFPKVSIVVARWRKKQEDRPGDGYFTGAQLAVVISGPVAGFKMIVHWQAEGQAMRNPSQPDQQNLDSPQ